MFVVVASTMMMVGMLVVAVGWSGNLAVDLVAEKPDVDWELRLLQ